MVHRPTHRFSSFLDRFEERLELDCEQLKSQLVAQVDHQFGVLRSKVTELRSRFGGGRTDRDLVPSLHLDDPQVETVSLDEWVMERSTVDESHNASSTSSGHKRKSVSHSQSTRKRQNTQGFIASGSNRPTCKYPGCGKAFSRDGLLVMHERIHLGIKPFSCSWPNCRYSAEQRSSVIRHVRICHFKLPKTLQQQYLLNIEDNRDANEYVQVDNQLEQRRIE